MDSVKWLDMQFKNVIGEKAIRLVLFPTPPTPVGDVLFMPDSFSSKTFDKSLDFNRDDGSFHPISMLPTLYGPAVLAWIRLKHLIGVKNGQLEIKYATCCARVTYSVLFDAHGIRYADTTTLEDVSLTPRSCHPGSHFVVPYAPYLTAMFHYALAPGRSEKLIRFTYMHPDEAMMLFPECDFTRNIVIDKFLSRCTIDPKVRYCNTHGGLGSWTKPYIRQIRRNLVDLEDTDHEQWIQRPYRLFGRENEVLGDAGQEDDGQGVAIADGGQASVAVHREGYGSLQEGS
jgi:hypothetical protein